MGSWRRKVFHPRSSSLRSSSSWSGGTVKRSFHCSSRKIFRTTEGRASAHLDVRKHVPPFAGNGLATLLCARGLQVTAKKHARIFSDLRNKFRQGAPLAHEEIRSWVP